MPPLDDGILLPIHAGKSISSIELKMQADNEVNGEPCDNISDKNANYNELTAIYWAWKNIKKLYPDVKYIGIAHYRRLFAFHDRKFFSEEISRPESEIANYRITPSELKKIAEVLDAGKIILVKPKVRPVPTFIECRLNWPGKDYGLLKDIFREKFPDYYDAFISIMEHSNKSSCRNMFIMKYEDFVKYSEWLISLMTEFEARLPLAEAYHQRIVGIMSEYLVSIWCKANKKKAKFSEMYFYEEDKDFKPVKKFLVPFYFIVRLAMYLRRELIASLMAQNFTWKIKKLITKLRKKS